MSEKKMMLGNAAIARGVWEAGCKVSSAYPGTPSTEISEELVKYPGVYAEWAPNEARMFSAPSIWGPWTQHPTPCVGPKSEITFEGQSTFILPYGDRFIFMADIWRPRHPSDARYIWLPIEFEKGKPVIRWRDSWNLDELR